MKFRRGAWLWEDGVIPSIARRLYSYEIHDDALLVTTLDRNGKFGEDRFEGTVLQLRITAPMPDVIRVQANHHSPAQKGVTAFDIDQSLRASQVKIEENADEVTFASGKLCAKLRKTGDWSLEFVSDQGAVTRGGFESLGYMRTPAGAFMMQRLSMSVGETIYGLGERFGPLVKNGQSISIWNEDGGTSSDWSYKNIPFYLSSAGYGLLVNSPAKVDFEIGTERVSQMQFAVPGESLDYYIFLGPTPKEIFEKYTRLTGRSAVPPDWSFGLWLSTSFTTKYDEKTVSEFVDGMIDRKIPLKVFHFDCFWMRERHWCDFQWDPAAFPDPRGMIRRLKNKGIKISLWINPYISQLSCLFEEGKRNGYFIRTKDGGVYQRDQWQPGMALVDFTNPAAAAWFASKLRALLEMGVDCFKTDFGERIPLDVVYHDGSDPALMHNYYPYLYNKTVFDLLEQHHGKGNAMVFARSATAGSQKFPVHWGGDCDATFESMAEDLRGGLSFCLSGPAFWSHDIGGFNGTATPALYKRWVAFGLLSTHSRLHGSGSYRVPWLFDEESVDVLRHFVSLKNSFFPYLFSAAHDAAAHGWPVMRAMHVEYPNDPTCRHLDRQYMLGEALLVAPVFNEEGIAEYYLPEGVWSSLFTNEQVVGGRWFKHKVDFMQIPLFVRENSIVAMSSNTTEPRWRLEDELTLNLFRIDDVAEIKLQVHTGEVGKSAHFTCRRDEQGFTLTSDGKAAKVRVLFRGMHRIAGAIVNGKVVGQGREGILVEWTDSSIPMSVQGASRNPPQLEQLLPQTGRAVRS